ncbi:hypothetical protein U2088_15460, partial [Listeria monocytogenes]|uniref:hypothetical protein n=1 Tax=Listeria monocytogenes TaxID=1639 RepID=UPI002FDBF665
EKYHYVSSYEIVKFDDCYIELVELFPCGSKIELQKREGEIIRQTEKCVNKRIDGRTRAEYNQDNKKENLERCKAYREKNKKTIAIHQKEY